MSLGLTLESNLSCMVLTPAIEDFLKKMTVDSLFVSAETLLFAIVSFATVQAHTTSRPGMTPPDGGEGGLGGLQSVLKNTVSPAFGATVIIIITVIVSGSAYLCFLKYICAGCCKPTQVAPVSQMDPNKSEEQV
ncbi:hypothetical protein MATL_G00179040 [Megalops atlanticus]|uniref:Uncharacterized protein n=1 Tax=Megalops atlanticus TaxID=7932 RepID=A0A9D3PM14_MEGAT|nr:hypothetical protein MATL_G00179040 [Megalops atlanticus]